MAQRSVLSLAALLLCLLAFAAPASAAPPTVTLQTPERSFSPDGNQHEDVLGLSYQVSERSRVSIVVVDASGEVVRRVQTDVPTEGSASFAWDGRRDASTAVAQDGVYRYRITAVNEAGETGSAERRIAIDTAPVAAITAPAADATVTGTVRVVVTPHAGRSLSGGNLYRCYWASQCAWQSLGSLDADDTLEWDTRSSSTGDTWLWGYVYYADQFGTSHSFPVDARHVVVQRPVTVSVNSAARFFSPDGDGHEDAYGIGYVTTAPGTANVRVRNAAGSVVRRLVSDVFVAEGGSSVSWDGRDDSGATVPDGEYSYTVDVVGAVGAPASASGRVGVDTAPVAEIVAPDEGAVVDGEVMIRVAPRSGRSLTGGTLYGCYYVGQCAWYGIGSLGEADALGVRGLTWNAASLPTGEKGLWGYAYYTDAFGAGHSYPLTVRRVDVRRAVALTLQSPERYFSPDGDGHEDAVGFSYAVTAAATVTINVSDAAGEPVRRIADAVAVAEGGHSVSWDGRNDDGERVPDGVYTYTVRAVGAIGEPQSASLRVGVDTAPVARIVAPEDGAVVDGQVTVRVAPHPGRALTGGTLYGCYYAGQCAWYGIGSLGEADAFGVRSVTFDTVAFPTGEKGLWGYAYYTDAFGAGHSYPLAVRRVQVRRAVTLTLQSPERYFSPDDDGHEDAVGVSYVITAAARVTIRVRDDAGGLVRRLETDVARDEGGHSFTWDGRDEDGKRVADGVYRYSVEAAGEIGEPVIASGRFGVDTRPVATLLAPAADAVVTGSVRVKIAPAEGRTITGGSLYLCYADLRCSWQGIGSLGVPDFDGTRGLEWNTATTPTGATWLWGHVYYQDDFGASHSYAMATRRVVVTRAVQISNVSSDRYFTPDGDGGEDTGGPSYCIDAPADMRLAITRDGKPVRTVRSDDRTQGCHSFSWDGRNEDGAAAPDGGYAYTLVATGPEGLATTVAGRIGVRRDPPGRVLRPVATDVLSRSAAFTFTPADVPVTEVAPCVTTAVCFPITAANASGQWATAMQLAPHLNGDRTLAVTVRWRDAYGSAHQTSLPPVPVTVNTAAPQLELEAAPAAGEAPVTSRIRLDARSESGRELSYRLDFGDGSPVVTGTRASPHTPLELEHAFTRPGAYRVLADVDDGAGNGARRSTLVTVTAPPNRPPTAVLTLDRDEGSAPFAVTATITGEDADDDALTYRVSFGDGSPERTGTLPQTPLTHTYATAGSFLVRLSVNDGERTTTRTVRVVTALSEPLTAAAGDDQQAQAGEAVAFDGGGSRPAALITRYEWDFGDGSSATGRAATHPFARAGHLHGHADHDDRDVDRDGHGAGDGHRPAAGRPSAGRARDRVRDAGGRRHCHLHRGGRQPYVGDERRRWRRAPARPPRRHPHAVSLCAGLPAPDRARHRYRWPRRGGGRSRAGPARRHDARASPHDARGDPGRRHRRRRPRQHARVRGEGAPLVRPGRRRGGRPARERDRASVVLGRADRLRVQLRRWRRWWWRWRQPVPGGRHAHRLLGAQRPPVPPDAHPRRRQAVHPLARLADEGVVPQGVLRRPADRAEPRRPGIHVRAGGREPAAPAGPITRAATTTAIRDPRGRGNRGRAQSRRGVDRARGHRGKLRPESDLLLDAGAGRRPGVHDRGHPDAARRLRGIRAQDADRARLLHPPLGPVRVRGRDHQCQGRAGLQPRGRDVRAGGGQAP
ncbi:PKD domain-containing protein [Solirubrobacter sp. CPCC 204708]|uniref:PKD domain-containing protein n=1 Tax=Solirubrobacter deserti TaxID=2282478 RepID=A0ABT4RKI3_9ACTN|nr:FlgD immunoglobulin-like domain containing protein [Solirubrobacter deserti]MBE2315872.1 PKD domain-containing protein [Solirubrobacter deserti]MDA0138790.1 PKD domain-containing protein [Solirubrobacter deserti]